MRKLQCGKEVAQEMVSGASGNVLDAPETKRRGQELLIR